MLSAVVEKLSATVTLPLVIDSSSPDAIERVVRSYAGKPLINSVNGKRESLDAVLPLAKKYGCAIIEPLLTSQASRLQPRAALPLPRRLSPRLSASASPARTS